MYNLNIKKSNMCTEMIQTYRCDILFTISGSLCKYKKKLSQ